MSTDNQLKRARQGGPTARPRFTRRLMRRGPELPETGAVPDEVALSSVWELTPAETTTVASAATGARRDALLRRSLAVSDVAAAYCALGVIALLMSHWGHVRMRPTVLLVAPFIVVAAKAIGLYDRDQHVLRKTTVDELPSIINLAVLYSLGAWLAEVALFQGSLVRAQIFALVLSSFVLIACGRIFVRYVMSRRLVPESCIVVGEARDCARVVRKLEHAPGVNARVVGRVGLLEHDGSRFGGALGRADLGQLAAVIADQHVERAIIVPDGHDQDEILHLIRLVKALGVKVSVLPRLLEVVGSSSTFEDVDGLALLGVRHYGVSKSTSWLKRALDLGVAGLGLLVLAPLMFFLAIAIKLDSRGPVFFRQRRIGRRGEVFEMLKFRSMVPEAEHLKRTLEHRNEAVGGLFKITDDPRITRVGRFLRRTSLDELPQLLNVLGGSMSLVGPRPLIEDEDALIEGWQRRRLAVKPGMTGLWQIFGSSRIPMDEMVKIDYLYGANWSLWLDLKILLRTIPYVLSRRGL